MVQMNKNSIAVSKVQDVASGVVHYIYWISCEICDSVVPIPEIYYAWNIRILDSPPRVRCDGCGGKVEQINEDIYPSEHWGLGPHIEHDEDTTLTSVPHRHRYVSDDFDDVRSDYMGFWVNDSFSKALDELKAFIVKE